MNGSGALPAPVEEALAIWLEQHDTHAPNLIEGLYVIGSLALDDWRPSSDIDIVAFTPASLRDEDVDALKRAHEAAVDEAGGIDIDGPRLAWVDVTQPPTPAVRPWTLHGDFANDDGCFEINPVSWLTLRRYGVSVRGPDPADLEISSDANQLKAFIKDNTAGYWRADADSILKALDDPDRAFDTELTVWCVLGIARMLYTARTGDVTSKSGAGRWLRAEMPEHHGLITHALDARRSGLVVPEPRDVTKQVAEFVHAVAGLVEQS